MTQSRPTSVISISDVFTDGEGNETFTMTSHDQHNSPHGMLGSYTTKRCRCDVCRAASADYVRNVRALRREARELINGRLTAVDHRVKHGTHAGYNNWCCRCVECTRAGTEYVVSRRKMRQGTTQK